MSSPTPGYDPNNPQGPTGWGAPQQSGYSAPPPAAPATLAPAMGMPDAVRTVLGKYADFSGRARRSEYWWFALAYLVVYVVATIIDQAFGFPILTLIVGLGLLVPSLAVSVRRLHDTDRSGWWLLLGLIPFGGIVVLVFECMDSQPGTNRFGPSPKYPAAAGY
jgi:uncharacterized membrane protein YhaH (DUF805 family)